MDTAIDNQIKVQMEIAHQFHDTPEELCKLCWEEANGSM